MWTPHAAGHSTVRLEISCQVAAADVPKIAHQPCSRLWQQCIQLACACTGSSTSCCILQDKQLQHQLQTLESRLQGLAGEDKEATEEELAGCTQLIQSLYTTPGQSVAVPQSQPSQSCSIAVGNAAPVTQQVQQPAVHSSSSQPAAPLLLGPP